MNKFDAVIACAGKGVRADLGFNKILLKINNKPMFAYSLEEFLKTEGINNIYLVINKDDEEFFKLFESDNVHIIYGGETRAESIRNGLSKVTTDQVVIHDAARPLIKSYDIKNILNELEKYDAVTYFHNVTDTVKKIEHKKVKTIDRTKLRAVTTPQAFKKKTYRDILEPLVEDIHITDEISLIEDNYKIGLIEERHNNIKVTNKADLKSVLLEINYSMPSFKIGNSYDFHTFTDDKKLKLAGVELPYEKGLKGHSDADVVCHAVAEAIIGALGNGDLGTHFPDNNPLYKGISSDFFVRQSRLMLREHGYDVSNIDITVFLEEPNLSKYKKEMEKNIATWLHIDSNLVNVKATTMEKRGMIGRKEGISCEATVLLRSIYI